MISLLFASLLMIHDGTVDKPARYHGLATIQLVDGRTCSAAVRVEDLPTRGFANRWHYLLVGCDFAPIDHELRFTFPTAAPVQAIAIEGWGSMSIIPIDPEVVAWCNAAALVPLDNPAPAQRTVTLRQVGQTWELLIEERV